MVINVTEQQKKLIESQGHMVVEFKAWAKNFFEWFNKWSRQIIDTLNLVINFLEQKVREAAFDLAKFFVDIEEKLEPMIEVLDTLEKSALTMIHEENVHLSAHLVENIIRISVTE